MSDRKFNFGYFVKFVHRFVTDLTDILGSATYFGPSGWPKLVGYWIGHQIIQIHIKLDQLANFHDFSSFNSWIIKVSNFKLGFGCGSFHVEKLTLHRRQDFPATFDRRWPSALLTNSKWSGHYTGSSWRMSFWNVIGKLVKSGQIGLHANNSLVIWNLKILLFMN